jgi:DNA-binding beta-propeller fold protein YncE
MYVGAITLGQAVVGSALSPCGHWLYVMSEAANATKNQGTFSVEKLKNDPASALVTSVGAGCNPVRVIVSHSGLVWETARASNRLLAFDTSILDIVASAETGTLSVGLAFAKGESRILTADSNRSDINGTTTGLSVVDMYAALRVLGNSSNAVLGAIPTGLFPREFALSTDGRAMLVTDYNLY